MKIGFTVLLTNAARKDANLAFASRKSKRVVHYVGGAELFALGDAVDEALLLQHDVGTLLLEYVHLRVDTDSSSLFNITMLYISTIERTLIVYLQATREAFDKMEIS